MQDTSTSAKPQQGSPGVKISVLCNNNIKAHTWLLPADAALTSTEKCSNGAQTWYDVTIKEIYKDTHGFVWLADAILRWFAEVTDIDQNAVLLIPPVLSAKQQGVMKSCAARVGVVVQAYGLKEAHTAVCCDLEALRSVPKRNKAKVEAYTPPQEVPASVPKSIWKQEDQPAAALNCRNIFRESAWADDEKDDNDVEPDTSVGDSSSYQQFSSSLEVLLLCMCIIVMQYFVQIQ